MADQNSDDYELMPSHELDDLRREVSALKKNSMTDGDKARVLIESMDRLSISINRLITILDDAQKDIIDEYQESKPAEKLNQLLEQNEMIAKALIAISENFNNGSTSNKSVIPPSYGISMPPQSPPMNGPMGTQMNNSRGMYPPNINQNQSFNPSMGPMDDLPPMDTLPPLDGSPPKKKFLGIM